MRQPAELGFETRGLKSLASCGGCAAKVDPALLALLTAAATDGKPNPDLIAGLTPYDDAAVFRLGDQALVSTVDFFPPLVDDPADYGAIAAANAVSDVYAMGGEVLLALVISAFPRAIPATVGATAVAAAAEVVVSCGGQIVGGHSIHCNEPVFGLAVTGLVNPGRVWRKSGARTGDVLMLSKPIGTGVLINQGEVATVMATMRQTNRQAAQALHDLPDGPNCVTDVTGYGLLGHSVEIAERSKVRIEIDMDQVPLLPGAERAAKRGVRTRADQTTRKALTDKVTFADGCAQSLQILLYDPQTSGGLLAAVAPEVVAGLERRGFAAIGRVSSGPVGVTVR